MILMIISLAVTSPLHWPRMVVDMLFLPPLEQTSWSHGGACMVAWRCMNGRMEVHQPAEVNHPPQKLVERPLHQPRLVDAEV